MAFADIERAVRANRRYRSPSSAGGLGWEAYHAEIVRILGNGGSAGGSDYDFAKTVEIWQKQQRFAPADCDGIIGPDTWRAIQRHLTPSAPTGAPTRAVILVPSQGHGVVAFKAVAEYLKRHVYHGGATIVKTLVTQIGPRPQFVVHCNTMQDDGTGRRLPVTCPVTFDAGGSPFDWTTLRGLTTVVTISHGGSDGPVLASHAGGHQPWGRQEGNDRLLSPAGQDFWRRVGDALAADGKVIHLGCMMGGTLVHSYGDLVARVTGKRVYAATAGIAAGRNETALRHVQAIESGTVLAPMREFRP